MQKPDDESASPLTLRRALYVAPAVPDHCRTADIFRAPTVAAQERPPRPGFAVQPGSTNMPYGSNAATAIRAAALLALLSLGACATGQGSYVAGSGGGGGSGGEEALLGEQVAFDDATPGMLAAGGKRAAPGRPRRQPGGQRDRRRRNRSPRPGRQRGRRPDADGPQSACHLDPAGRAASRPQRPADRPSSACPSRRRCWGGRWGAQEILASACLRRPRRSPWRQASAPWASPCRPRR